MKASASLASLLLGLALLAGAVAGCGSVAGGNAAFDAMTKDSTPFYLTGPGEAVPDRYLGYGTRCRIVGSSGDYIRIQLVSGETGFVQRNNISELQGQ